MRKPSLSSTRTLRSHHNSTVLRHIHEDHSAGIDHDEFGLLHCFSTIKHIKKDPEAINKLYEGQAINPHLALADKRIASKEHRPAQKVSLLKKIG